MTAIGAKRTLGFLGAVTGHLLHTCTCRMQHIVFDGAGCPGGRPGHSDKISTDASDVTTNESVRRRAVPETPASCINFVCSFDVCVTCESHRVLHVKYIAKKRRGPGTSRNGGLWGRRINIRSR